MNMRALISSPLAPRADRSDITARPNENSTSATFRSSAADDEEEDDDDAEDDDDDNDIDDG